MEKATALAKTHELVEGIEELARLFDEDQWDKSGPLRKKLNILWGELTGPLSQVNIPREWQQYGHTFPIFETALGAYSDGTNREAMGYAIDALSMAIGGIQALPEATAPGTPTVQQAPVIMPNAHSVGGLLAEEPKTSLRWPLWIIFGGAFLAIGRYWDQIWNSLFSPDGIKYATIGGFAIGLGVAGICTNLMSGLIESHGWTGVFRKHPIKGPLYVVLILLGGVLAVSSIKP